MSKKTNTSWGKVADWYGDYLEGDDTYQSKVILPNLLRILNIKNNEKGLPEPKGRVLDLACGQGFFAKEVAKLGANCVGADISPELIAKARVNAPSVSFYIAPATALAFAHEAEFDTVYCVLALQNIDDLAKTFAEVKRVLKVGGRFIMVLNHPCFRVLKGSSWGYEPARMDSSPGGKNGTQYRRVDSYLTAGKFGIEMNPSKEKSAQTISYHRSLQDFFKPLTKAGFAITKLEEWVSHKISSPGPRQPAENLARKEIPLFLMLEAQA